MAGDKSFELDTQGAAFALELALGAYLRDLAASSRVLWIGAPRAASTLERLTELDVIDVTHSDVQSKARKTRGRRRKQRVQTLSQGNLPSLAKASYDLVVASDLRSFESERTVEEKLATLVAALEQGWLVAGVTRDQLDATRDFLTDMFEGVEVLGCVPFSGSAIANLEVDTPDVVVDATLVSEGEMPALFYVIAGKSSELFEDYTIVRVPGGAPIASISTVSAPEDDREVAALRKALVRAEERAKEAGAALRLRQAELSELQAQPNEGQLDTSVTDALEKKLAQSGKRIRELEDELKTQKTVTRDVVARLELGGGSASKSDERAAAVFAQVAELEEQLGMSQAQLELARAEMADMRGAITRAENERNRAMEELELEAMRLRNELRTIPPPGSRAAKLVAEKGALEQEVSRLKSQLAELSVREGHSAEVDALKGELEGLRQRMSERERALTALKKDIRQNAEVAQVASATSQAEEQAVIAELEEKIGHRDAMISRLQSELMDWESGSEHDAYVALQRANAELAQLKETLVLSSSAVDERDVYAAECERLEEERDELANKLSAALFAHERASGRSEAAHRESLEELQAELQAVRGANDLLRAKREEDTQRYEEVSVRLTEREKTIMALQSTVREVEEELDRYERKAAGSESSQDALRQKISELKQSLTVTSALRARSLSEADGASRERDLWRAAAFDLRGLFEDLERASNQEEDGERAEITSVGDDAPVADSVAMLEAQLQQQQAMVTSLTKQLEEKNKELLELESESLV